MTARLRRLLRHIPAPLLAIIVLSAFPEASDAYRITSVKIVSVVPNPIPCGSSAIVTVDVGYRHNELADTYPINGLVEIWENDWTFFDADEKLADNGAFAIQQNDPNPGTKTVTVQITCDPADAKGKCKLRGNFGADDEYGEHEIYAKVSGISEESGNVTVTCTKPDGTLGASDGMGEPGGLASTEWNLRPTQPLASLRVALAYDAANLQLLNAAFDPSASSYFAFTHVDGATPGLIYFEAANPSNVSLDSLPMRAIFAVNPAAPYGQSPIRSVDPTGFADQSGAALAISLGDGHIVIVPVDTELPTIDTGLLAWEPASRRVVGMPGAVSDNLLAIGPGYVTVSLRSTVPGDDVAGTQGEATVQADGSFVLEPIELVAAESPVELRARDGMDNRASVSWMLPATGVDAPGSALAPSLRVAPNPASGRTEVNLALPRAVEILRVEVFDAQGRRVHSLWNAPAPGGRLSLVWDGSTSGQRCAPGLYLIRALGTGLRMTQATVRIQ